VITGCCIRIGQIQTTFSEESLVTFYELNEEEIDSYVFSEEPMGKAGAYAIQQAGGLFVERIEGDFYNIVGLPIARLKREIESLIKEFCSCTESTENTLPV
jgi:septum formation protein